MKRLWTIRILAAISIAWLTDLKSAEANQQDDSNNKPWPKIQNDRSYNIFTFAEFMYWRISSPHLSYGRDGVNTTLTGSPITKAGTSYYPDFDYNPGFRVGLGAKFGPKKAFDCVGLYGWLYSDPKDSASTSQFSGNFVPLNWFAGPTTNTFTFGSLALGIHFNWVEVQSGYTFSPNRYLSLRPYFALTSYIIDGDLDAEYHYIDAASGNLNISKTHGDCESWSIGPKVGLDFIIHATKNFGIFTNINITQQINTVHMKTKEEVNGVINGVYYNSFVAQKGKLKQEVNISYIGMEIGPTWDMWFSKDRYHLQLRATYAGANLIGGNNLSFLTSTNQDITMNTDFRGLNVRATFEF